MPWGIAALVTACVLALPTTTNSLWIGQTTPLIVAGVAYGLAASRTRPWFAGIVLGVVLMVTTVAWWSPVYRFEILVTGAWLIAATFSSILWTHYMLMLVTPAFGFVAMSRTRLTRQWPYIGIATLVILLSYPITNPIAATPYTDGFMYSGITAMLLALALLLIIGGCHAFAVHRYGDDDAGEASTGVGSGLSAKGTLKVPQPEPMVLFDLRKR